MPLVFESHDSLPYIDPDASGSDREEADALISRELRKINQEALHPSLQPLHGLSTSELMRKEIDRVSTGSSWEGGIELSRYEAPDEPGLDDNAQIWHKALRTAYTSSAYLAGRGINMSLLEELGKNAWLISNSQLDDILKSLDKELELLKQETDLVNRERKAMQESAKPEIIALEDTWKRGGFIYFISHPSFYPLFRARLLPIVLISIFVYTILFTFAFLPQVVFLAIFHYGGAWINATILVLGEGAAIVAILFESFFVDETLVDVFDAVLVNEGLGDLVSQGRLLDPTAENAVKSLGKPTISSVYAPFSLRQIIEFILLLPLNLVPFVGVPLFLFLTGYRAGPFHHWRYFKLLGFRKKERTEYIRQRQLKYTWFGTVAMVLQLVPVLSMLFLLTTAAGSALWAARMERARRMRAATIERLDVAPYRDEAA
ncbi:hypothetical protein DV737_g4745, partial [Chaetothyriales sp. CBS 132003]